MKNKKIIIFMVIVLLLNIYYFVPSFRFEKVNDLVENFKKDSYNIVMNDRYMPNYKEVLVEDNRIYIDVNFIKENIDSYIFYDKKEEKVIITTENKVIKMKNKENQIYINENEVKLNFPFKIVNDVAYVNIKDFENLYDLNVFINEEQKLVVIDEIKDKKMAKVIDKSVIRFKNSHKSPIIKRLEKNEDIIIYKSLGEYYYVRSIDGILGYLKKKDIGKIYLSEVTKKEEKIEEKENNKKVNLAWHQIGSHVSSKNYIKEIDGLDVISPTWFSLSNNEGDVRNKASLSYVKDAHKKGYKIWALVDNQFNSKLTYEVLSSSQKREKVIKKILAYASIYNLDGINIDFENINKKTGEYYVQFFRELYPLAKKENLTISVDMYVPSASTRHYNRKEVAKVVDYMIIMAYDEHWSTSPQSGSIASLPWVEKGIIKTVLSGVENKKIILGVPFYSRIWQEKDGEIIDNSAYSMNYIQGQIKENNASVIYNPFVGQNYTQYTKNGIIHKIWIEDETSMKKRVDLVNKYNLSGVAAWKKGLENDIIWEIINNNI